MSEPGNATSIPRHVVCRLIELGADDRLDRPEIESTYSDLRAHERLDNLHWSEWDAVAAALSTQELESLLKGLTIAELRLGWRGGGSVSAVIWIFRQIQRRSQKDADRLYEWVIRRTANYRQEIGEMPIPREMIFVLDGMTQEQREEWFVSFRESRNNEIRQLIRQRHAKKLTRRKNGEEEAEARKNERINRKAQKDATDEKMRSERARLIDAAQFLDAKGRLTLIADNPSVSLDAFPADWACVSPDIVAVMDSEHVKALLSRCREKRRGVWHDLAVTLSTHRLLTESEGDRNDEQQRIQL